MCHVILGCFSLRDDDPSLEGNHKTTCLSLTDVKGSHDDINQTASRMDLCLTCTKSKRMFYLKCFNVCRSLVKKIIFKRGDENSGILNSLFKVGTSKPDTGWEMYNWGGGTFENGRENLSAKSLLNFLWAAVMIWALWCVQCAAEQRVGQAGCVTAST